MLYPFIEFILIGSLDVFGFIDSLEVFGFIGSLDVFVFFASHEKYSFFIGLLEACGLIWSHFLMEVLLS